jgi:uncharacterized membrane protein HdeD (DUF308 family)
MWLIGLGIASVVIGVIVLVWPKQTLHVIGICFGIYLLISGVMEIVVGFSPGRSGGFRFLSILTGALSVMLGLISFRGALESILLLALWIGFGWLIIGITRLVAAASEPLLPYRGWQIFGGILLTLGGIVTIIWPLHSVFALSVLAGIWLIVIGLWELIEAFIVHRRAAKALAS